MRTIAIIVLLATSTAAAPTVSFSTIGLPVKESDPLGWCIGPDGSGNADEVAYICHDGELDGGTFFLSAVDLTATPATVTQYASPVSLQPRQWCAILGDNNKIYMAGVGVGGDSYVFKFDPLTSTLSSLGRITQAGDPNTTVWTMTLDSANGRIYCGAFPSAFLHWIDTADDSLHSEGSQDATDDYARYTAYGSTDNYVYNLIMFSSIHVGYYDATGDTSGAVSGLPAYGTGDYFVLATDGYVYYYDLTATQWYKMDSGAATTSSAPTQAVRGTTMNGVFTGGSHQNKDLWDGDYVVSVANTGGSAGAIGEITINNSDDTLDRVENYAYSGNASIYFVDVGPNEDVYGSSVSPLRLFHYDPATDDLDNTGEYSGESLGEFSQATGHGYSSAVDGNDLYVGAYGAANLSVYDTTAEVNFPTNPDNFGTIGSNQNRPHSMDVLGLNLWVGTRPDNGLLGGAISKVVLSSQAITAYRFTGTPAHDSGGAIADHSVISVAADSVRTRVWCGTDIKGGASVTPTATDAKLFSFDPSLAQVDYSGTPMVGVDSINALCVANDTDVLYVASGDSTACVVFDMATETVTTTITLPDICRTNAMQLHTVDNHVYGMADQTFFRIVPTTHAVETLGTTTGADRGFALIPGRDEMYYSDGANLMRATISRSPNAAIAGGRVF